MADPKEAAKQCYLKGSEAVNKENYDYAIDMFYTAVALCPDNLMYRQLLRSTEAKKIPPGTKLGLMQKPKLMKLRGKVAGCRRKKDWDEMDKAAEEGLKLNPHDGQFNADAGEACLERDFGEVAVLCYKCAVSPNGDPENIDYLRILARLLKQRGEYDDSVKFWQRIKALDPNDREAREEVLGTMTAKTIDHGNFETAGSTRDVMNDAEIAKRLGKDNERKRRSEKVDEAGIDPVQDMIHQIRKDDQNPDLHMKLGELYISKSQFDDAIECFRQAFELKDGDQNIRERIEDIEILKLNQMLENEKQKSVADPENQEQKAKVSKIANKLLAREIEVYKDRVKRYPAIMKLKFELARRYRRKKMWAEAIPLYQQASNDPRLEVESLVSLGKCFLQDNRPQLALRQFEKAAGKIKSTDDREAFLEVHYYLGRLYEQAKQKPKAEDHYGEVLSNDYDYRDVRARLERLQNEAP